MPRALLLLNLAILVANFLVALGATSESNAVLRTTGRVLGDWPRTDRGAGSVPGERSQARIEWAGHRIDDPQVARRELAGAEVAGAEVAGAEVAGAGVAGAERAVVRLGSFLTRMDAADRLTEEQMAAVYREVLRCDGELRDAAGQWQRGVPNGARAREFFGAVRSRLRRETEMALRNASLDERELLARMVRVVLASAG